MTHTLSSTEVERVARLARLDLSPDEVEQLARELTAVLGYVEILSEVDTDEVLPMAHAVERTNVFREDTPQASLPRESALLNAPANDGRYFIVPQILDAS